jgi:tetratricopeptide (TPR) repeat protein
VKKIFFVFLFLPLMTAYSQQANFDTLVNTGIHQIYNIKFTEAEVTFRKLIADYPDHPAGRFFLAMTDWWRILLDLDVETYDDIFYQKLEDVIFQCDRILDKDKQNVDALFFKGGAIGFRGRLRAYRESWIKAADDGREALPIVQRASELDPSNKDVELGFGIYNYYASVIPADYPFLKPLMIFFPSGNKEKGIAQLKTTASEGKYAKYEAQYFLMTLYYQYENNPWEADKYADTLVSAFPDNPTFQRWQGRIAAKRGDTGKASEIFKNVLNKSNEGMTGYNTGRVKREAAYYVGLQYRNINTLDSSKHYFEQSYEWSKQVDGREPSGFQINTVLYLGMLNDQMGNRDEAVSYYRQLLDMKEYGSSHSLAKEYLEKPFVR